MRHLAIRARARRTFGDQHRVGSVMAFHNPRTGADGRDCLPPVLITLVDAGRRNAGPVCRVATGVPIPGKGTIPDGPEQISGESSEIHLASWCFAASRCRVIKGLQDLHFFQGIRMLQT